MYVPRSARHAALDGAYFGTTFPHLFLLAHPDCVPPRPERGYVPRVYGFRISRESQYYRRRERGAGGGNGGGSRALAAAGGVEEALPPQSRAGAGQKPPPPSSSAGVAAASSSGAPALAGRGNGEATRGGSSSKR